MVTIINTPGSENSNDNGLGPIITLLVLFAFALFFFYYGLPALRRYSSPPQINVPDKVDININPPQGQ